MQSSAMVLVMLASVGTNPIDNVLHDSVDLIEVNHLYDRGGQHVLDQLIFYDWSQSENRFQVRAWRMLKTIQQEPQRDWKANCYTVIFHDHGVLRHVRSPAMRHSWTQFDPEVAERDVLPPHKRRQLSALKVKGATVQHLAASEGEAGSE